VPLGKIVIVQVSLDTFVLPPIAEHSSANGVLPCFPFSRPLCILTAFWALANGTEPLRLSEAREQSAGLQ